MKNMVTNWRPYSIPRSAINCFNALGYAASLVEEHPKMNHQPFHNSTSGTKVVISSDFTKQIACFYQCDSCNFLVDFL